MLVARYTIMMWLLDIVFLFEICRENLSYVWSLIITLDFLKKIYPLIIIFPLFSAIAMVVFGRKRGFSYAKIYSGFFMFVTLC